MPMQGFDVPGFDPIASGRPYAPYTGLEGLPGLDTNPVLRLLAAPFLDYVFGQSGLAPMGIHGQNVYDVIKKQQFTRQHEDLISYMAETDRAGYVQTLRGIAAQTGVPWGMEQRMAAHRISGAAVAASPFLAVMAPEILDQLAGRRGSAVVMAHEMGLAGRYRSDPVTGRLGMSADSNKALARGIYEDLYQTGDVSEMQGISAGQLGGLFKQLQSRGMLMRAPGSARTRTRETLQQLGKESQAELETILQENNISTPVDRLSGSELDTLTSDDRVADRLRAIDKDKVKRSLKDYVGAISAMRDIFGDNGNPNAPMRELMAGLEQLSQGGLSKLDASRLETIVRTTGNLAKSAGIDLGVAATLQQHAANKAVQLGLDPLFAIPANQGSIAFGAAYREDGRGAITSWGKYTADQFQQLDSNLRLGAAASELANQSGAVLRLRDQFGGFEKGSQAAAYATALERGQLEWVDPTTNKRRSTALSSSDVVNILEQATLSTGEDAGLTPGFIMEAIQDRRANSESIFIYGGEDLTRRHQLETDVLPYIAQQTTFDFGQRLRDLGVKDTDARRISEQVADRVAAGFVELSAEELGDPVKRAAAVAELLRQAVTATGNENLVNTALTNKGISDDAFYRGSGISLAGGLEESLPDKFPEIGNIVNITTVMDRDLHNKAARIREKALITNIVQKSMSSLGSNSVLRNFFEALQDTNEIDPKSWERLLGTTVGGISIEKLRETLEDPADEIRKRQNELTELITNYENAEGDVEKSTAHEAAMEAAKELSGLRSDFADLAEKTFGIDSTATLTKQDFIAAENSLRSLERLQSALPTDKTGYWETTEGQQYDTVATTTMAKYEDIALRVIMSDETSKKLGLAGVTTAEQMLAANRKLNDLAVRHGISTSQLLAGDYSGEGSDEDKQTVISLMKQLDQGRVELERITQLPVDTAADSEEETKKAQKIIDRIRDEREISAKDLITEFADKFGVTFSPTEVDELAGEIGGSESTLDRVRSAIEHQKNVQKTAGKLYEQDSNKNTAVDRMLEEYRRDPAAVRLKAAQEGLSESEINELENSIQQLEETDLSRIGSTGHRGSERVDSPEAAVDLIRTLIRDMNRDTAEGATQRVELTNSELTISGTLDIVNGQVIAKASPGGKNDVVSEVSQ